MKCSANQKYIKVPTSFTRTNVDSAKQWKKKQMQMQMENGKKQQHSNRPANFSLGIDSCILFDFIWKSDEFGIQMNFLLGKAS